MPQGVLLTDGAPVIAPDDPTADDVRALLARHLAFAREHTPPIDVHARDVDGLVDPAISFFSYRRDGKLLAVGAQPPRREHAELKSMHTAAEAQAGDRSGDAGAPRGHGARRGYRRLSLETGTMDAFAPARALYAAAGFVPCPPFAGYRDSPNSTCMTLVL